MSDKQPIVLRGDETPEELAKLLISNEPLAAADIASGIELAARLGELDMGSLQQILQKALDYVRLMAALARLQAQIDSVEIVLGNDFFQVIIQNLLDADNPLLITVDRPMLFDAVNAALEAYDKAKEDSHD